MTHHHTIAGALVALAVVALLLFALHHLAKVGASQRNTSTEDEGTEG